jgi:hypothetical protein
MIDNFIDIFIDYYKLYYNNKIYYCKNIRENKLYNIINSYNNNELNLLYLIYFNNPKYYENNDIENLKNDIKSYIMKYNNYDYNELYNKIKELYNEEIIGI